MYPEARRKRIFRWNRFSILRAVRQHRDRAAARTCNVAPVLDDLAARLLDRLDDTTRQFATALDFGGRGAIAPALLARGMAVVSADISAPMAALRGRHAADRSTAEDFASAVEQFDLVVAHLALHWINDLPGALIQLRRALKPGGLFLASMPVLGTLAELRSRVAGGRGGHAPAASARASRPFRTCAIAPGCCSAPASRSRSPMSRRSTFYTPTRWRCCTSCATPARPTPLPRGAANSRRALCSPPPSASLPMREGRYRSARCAWRS